MPRHVCMLSMHAGAPGEMPGVRVSKVSLPVNAMGEVAGPATLLTQRKAALAVQRHARKQRSAAR